MPTTEETKRCEQARVDINAFFASQKNTKDFKANGRVLSRAFAHMRDENDPAKPSTRCESCWKFYQRLRRMYDSD